MDLLRRAGERLARELGLTATPLRVDAGTVTVMEVAGLIRVSPSLELEVVPKFLGWHSERWREDFFLLAALSRFGKLLPREDLGSSYSRRGDLATLVSRSLIAMYEARMRRNLRVYRKLCWRDDALDGEAEEEDLITPDPLGILQTGLVLTKDNRFNATIVAAAATLLLEVQEIDTRRQLIRVIRDLQPQSSRDKQRASRFPSRYRQWKPLFDLSQQVLRGFGTSLNDRGSAIAPGFVLRTAALWEDILGRLLRTGLSPLPVVEQKRFYLGSRIGGSVEVAPDISVNIGPSWYLADAKYKGRSQQSLRSVASTDVYESLAFMRASACRRMLLYYPDDTGLLSCGEWKEFDHVKVGSKAIVAVRLGVSGVSNTGGIRRLSEGTASAFRSVHDV